MPEIFVGITDLGSDRFRIVIEDNGPGIVRRQIPNIFGKLLYGSKFHRLKMNRGQQGIGISAAGMYGMLTTGKPVEIISRTDPGKPAHHFLLQIDTKKNKPEVISDKEVEWEVPHGTRVAIELEGKHTKGKQSVDEYVRQTVIANPQIRVRYQEPSGEVITYERASDQLPAHTSDIKPHPYGVELGVLQAMLKDTKARNIAAFPIPVTILPSVLEPSSPVIPTISDPVAFSPIILPTATFAPPPIITPTTQAPPTTIPPTLEPPVGSEEWRQQLEPLWDGTISSVLIVGKFRRESDLVGMSLDDQRNILITELGGRTNQSGGYYQSLDNDTLAGVGALLVFVRAAKIRSDQDLKTITVDDIRNIFIVEIYARTGRADLQGLSNIQLVRLALSLQW